MPGFPDSEKFRKVFATFGPAQRRQFWQATGIDIKKKSVNEQMFEAFKGALAGYREFLAKSNNQVGKRVEAASASACDACGRTDEHDVYVVTVPKCGRFCGRCIDELIRDADSIA